MVTMIIPLKITHVHLGSATHSHTFPDQPFVTGSCHSRNPASDIGDPGMCLSASNPPQIERICMSTYGEQLIQCHYLCSVNVVVPHQTIYIYHIRMMRPPGYNNDSYEINIRTIYIDNNSRCSYQVNDIIINNMPFQDTFISYIWYFQT